MPVFEIAVYNAEVRRLLKEGERHKQLSDAWGDVHYVEITAADENAAWAQARARYGEDRGYVIEALIAV